MANNLRSAKPADFTMTYEFDGEIETVTFEDAESIDVIFATAAQEICFSDCTDIRNVRLHDKKYTYHYTGWQPGMVYEFADETGEVVWTGCFPRWDH